METTRLSSTDLEYLREVAKTVHSFHCPGTDVFGVKTAGAVFGLSDDYIRGAMKEIENRVQGLKEGAYRWCEYTKTLIRLEE